VSASTPSRMPSASVATDPPPARPGDRWRLPGLVLLGTWSALFVVAIGLWVFAAFLSGTGSGDRGLVRIVGAPFVLVAVGLLWWAWWSSRALRDGRREGWTLLLVLGGVSVAQAILTARTLLATSSSTANGATTSGPPREVVGGLLAVIALGLVSVVVAVLARRSWAAADAADDTTDDVSDRG
jgi:cytochrome c oxidase assembly factor CtaG